MTAGPHEVINPPGLMPGRGFSHVVAAAPGRHVFVAGQTAHDADGNLHGDSVAAQFDAAVANLATALEAAGARPEHLVDARIYVTDVEAYRAQLDAIGSSYRRHLGRHYPAISLFGVPRLFDAGALVEIVATAIIPDEEGGGT